MQSTHTESSNINCLFAFLGIEENFFRLIDIVILLINVVWFLRRSSDWLIQRSYVSYWPWPVSWLIGVTWQCSHPFHQNKNNNCCHHQNYSSTCKQTDDDVRVVFNFIFIGMIPWIRYVLFSSCSCGCSSSCWCSWSCFFSLSPRPPATKNE